MTNCDECGKEGAKYFNTSIIFNPYKVIKFVVCNWRCMDSYQAKIQGETE